MIIGVGVDTVEISRIKKACKNSHFINRIYTETEIREFDPKMLRAASDFAGKEAVSKIFGTGFNGIEACDIEILRDKKGAPYVVLHGAAKKLSNQLGISNIKVSITNTSDVATAFAVGSSN